MGIIESVVLDKPRLKIHFTSTTNADFFYSQYSLTFPFHIKFTATGAKSAIRSLVAIGDFANCLSTQNAILESLPFYLIFFFYSSFVETFFLSFLLVLSYSVYFRHVRKLSICLLRFFPFEH